jgi:hypothetical protein
VAEFNPIEDISAIELLLLQTEDLVFDTRREIGHLLFPQTSASKIPSLLAEAFRRLKKLSGDITANAVEQADFTSKAMLNACLAGVAMTNPSQARDLEPLLQRDIGASTGAIRN